MTRERLIVIGVASFLVLCLIGALIVTFTSMFRGSQPATPATNAQNQNQNPQSTPPSRVSDNPADVLQTAADNKNPSLVDVEGNPNYSLQSYERLENNRYIVARVTTLLLEAAIVVIDTTRPVEAAIVLGPKASFTEEELRTLPEAVYNYVNGQLRGDF